MTHFTSSPRRNRGFSLVELLVAIGILVGLLAILVPMVVKARKSAARTRLANDLQTIATALDAYKTDFGDYPRVQYDPNSTGPTLYDVNRPNPPSGAQILCRALIGPAPASDSSNPSPPTIAIQDGNNGPGFRIRAQGKVSGPYLPADKFKVGLPSGSAVTPNAPTNSFPWVILDSDGNPILYFPRRVPNPPANQYLLNAITMSAAYPSLGSAFTAAEQYAYDIYDNALYFLHSGETSGGITNAAKRIHILLHDYNPANPSDATYNFNGQIDANNAEGPVVSEPYLLWMAGPDGKFGTDSVAPADRDIRTCDDVTNFNQ